MTSFEIFLTGETNDVVDKLLGATSKDDPVEALAVVEKAVSRLATAISSRKKINETTTNAAAAESSFGTSLCTVNNISFLQPRGKFMLDMGSEGVALTNAKAELAFLCTWTNVVSVLRFPKPDPYKSDKQGHNQMLLVALKNPTASGKTKVSSLVCSVDGKKTLNASLLPAPLAATSSSSSSSSAAAAAAEPFAGPEPETLGALLVSAAASKGVKVGRVGAPDPSVFSSNGGAACVACYLGVKDGHLYPMRQGLVFFKPPLFLPIDDIESMSIASDPRRRAVEMTVEMEDGSVHEFGQIVKEELEPLQRYAQFIAKRRQRQEKEEEAREKKEQSQLGASSSSSSSSSSAAATTEGAESEVNDDDDDEEDDSDFDESSSESGEDESSDEEEESGDKSANADKKSADATKSSKEVANDGKSDDDGDDNVDSDDDDDSDDSDSDDDDGFEEESNPALSDTEGGTEIVVVPEGKRAMRSSNDKKRALPSVTAEKLGLDVVATATSKAAVAADDGTESESEQQQQDGEDGEEPPAKRASVVMGEKDGEGRAPPPVTDLTALSPAAAAAALS